jgi:ATP-dependent DNA helicase RecQ
MESRSTSNQRQMLLKLLKKHWGYDSFRPLQEEAIASVLQRRDSLVVLPTGGGKSLCYQLPALCMEGVAIVVSPLISLMKDQVDSLREIGIVAGALNSTADPEEVRAIYRDVREGRLKILYLAPERLLSPSTLQWLSDQTISMIAIDEAHCISSWGHDFRPEYRALSQIRKRFPNTTLHGFTATATEQVRSDIAAQLQLVDAEILVGNFHRPNLIYHVERRSSGIEQIAKVMSRFRDQSGIIYAITRDKVEQLSEALNAKGFRTRPYHAGLSESVRTKNQEALINDEIEAIVATVAFGMGIDKSNVRYVIHAEMPKSLEGYQQESGRAGRDGLESECWLFHSGGDFQTWQRIIEKSSEDARENGLRSIKLMSDFCSSVVCRHRQLVEHFGQKLDVDCQACDVCLGKVAIAPDSLIIAQKILSCVVRCKESFGAEHIAKVLIGSDDARVIKFGHEKLSTWGLLKEYSKAQVRNWIDQLVGQGCLESSGGEYPTLRIGPNGRPVLKSEKTPVLSMAVAEPGGKASKRPAADFEGVDRGLFEELRVLRRQLALQAVVPAFIIFSDTTLCDLARRRPVTLAEMLKVHGVGQRKCEEHGETVTRLIARYCSEHMLATNVAAPAVASAPARRKTPAAGATNGKGPKEAVELFEKGLSIGEISLRIGRAPSTVHGYFIEYLQDRQITDASRWVSAEEIEWIESEVRKSEDGRLKPIYEALEGKIGYDVLRIVVTCMRNRENQ